MLEPHLITLQQIGEPEIGYISIAQSLKHIPFSIRRVYWIYQTPESVQRGNHAHKNTVQLLVCVAGKITITLESRTRKVYKYVLDNPNQGLYIPNFYWRKLDFSENAVCLCMSSSDYDEADYIREYEQFFDA
jgi:dTDP-4-dehydrorhamnose 3,5-epimerase-like enzyme